MTSTRGIIAPMSHAGFVHLRAHTPYSLSEGAIKLDDLARLRSVEQHL